MEEFSAPRYLHRPSQLYEKLCVPHTTFWNDFCTCPPVSHRMPRTCRKFGNVIVAARRVQKCLIVTMPCPRMGRRRSHANGSSLRGAGHPVFGHGFAPVGLHDTGRSCVTTCCRRRMTVWGRPHDVSAQLLYSAAQKAITKRADSHVLFADTTSVSVSCGTVNFSFPGVKTT